MAVMTTTIAARTHIRWMIRQDMPEVVAVEAASFDRPWSEDDFLRCLRGRNCVGMVAETPPYDGHYNHGVLAGYMIYESRKGYLEILNLAVRPGRRRLGVGAAMVRKLKGKLGGSYPRRLSLVVGERNLPAALFFKAMGFRCERILRGFYEDTGQDGYRFVYRLPGKEGEDVICTRHEAEGRR
jgi:ribosomal-protein-alanine N-acetyltransferase